MLVVWFLCRVYIYCTTCLPLYTPRFYPPLSPCARSVVLVHTLPVLQVEVALREVVEWVPLLGLSGDERLLLLLRLRFRLRHWLFGFQPLVLLKGKVLLSCRCEFSTGEGVLDSRLVDNGFVIAEGVIWHAPPFQVRKSMLLGGQWRRQRGRDARRRGRCVLRGLS